MKTFFDIFKIAFLIVGTVIGAGFITGKELVRFYGGCFLLPACFFTATLFGTFAWILLRLGERGRMIGNAKGNRLFEGVRYVVLLVTSGAMLAGIDGVQGQVFGGKTPFFSLIALFLTVKIAKKGIEGLGKCNALLVPAMLILFLGGLTARGRFPVPLTGDCTGTYTILIYLSMNAFLASPVLIDAGKRYEKRTFLPASLLAGVMIGSCIFFAMGNLSTLGDDVQNVDVPILKLWNSLLCKRKRVFLLRFFLFLWKKRVKSYHFLGVENAKFGAVLGQYLPLI